MTISNDLWSENLNLAYASLETPFVKGIQDGNLPIERFKAYIAQDSFFLEAFAKGYGMAIAQSPDKKSITILSEMLNGVIEELKLHENYAEKWGVNLKEFSLNSATQSYTRFLYQTSQNQDMVRIISAMTPCMRLYSWIGQSIQSGSLVINNPYIEWINTYANKSFENLAYILEDLIDSYYKLEDLKDIKVLYNRAMILEFQFFQASY